MVNGRLAHGDALDGQHGKFRHFVVIPRMVTIRAFGGGVVWMDDAFEHNFRARGHVEVRTHRFADFRARAAQQPGELVFRKCVRNRCHRSEHGSRVAAQRDGDGEGFIRIGGAKIAVIQRAAAMRQPAHDEAVFADDLLAINAQILTRLARPSGNHQAPGNQRRHIARPAMLDGQLRQIHLGAFAHNLAAGRIAHLCGCHVQQLAQHGAFFPRIAQVARRFGFFQIRQQAANFAQRCFPVAIFRQRLAHAREHARRCAKQIRQHRHRLRLSLAGDVLKQQGRPLRAQGAVGDGGHFQMRVDGGAHPPQFAERFQAGDEIAQIAVLHGRGLKRR